MQGVTGTPHFLDAYNPISKPGETAKQAERLFFQIKIFT